MRMSHLKVGSAADIPINISETDLSLLTATVVPPSGREEPCLLKRLRNGHVGKRLRENKSFSKEPGVVIAYSPNTWEVEVGESGNQSLAT